MPTVFRVDPTSVMTTAGNVAAGGDPALFAVARATVQLFTDAACTIVGTAYTDATGNTACPAQAPVTLPGSSVPSSVAGPQGQFGFWLAAGTYYYRLTLADGAVFSGFPISAGGGGASPTPVTLPFLVSSDFIFTPVAPGGNLIIGVNVITFPTVPAGVSGANTGHLLYVSGGVGAAEACLIVGGSGVPGQHNGQILVSCANTHSGGWTIQSATAGIQEAMMSAAATAAIPPAVRIPAGVVTVYGKITFPCGMSLRGEGMLATRLTMAAGFVGRAVEFGNAAGNWLDFGDLAIIYTTNGTSGEALYLGSVFDSVVSNLETLNSYDSITVVTGQRLHIIGGSHFPRHNGYNFSGAVAAPIITGGVIGLQPGVGNGVVLGDTVAGLEAHGLGISLGAASVASAASTGAINEFIFDGCIFDQYGLGGIMLQLTGTATSSRGKITNCMFAGNGAAQYAILASASSAGTIVGLTIANNTMAIDAAGGAAVLLSGVSGASITGNVATTSAAGGIAFELASLACTDTVIAGNIFGLGANYNTTNGFSNGFIADAHAHTRITVVGNSFNGTAKFTNNSTVVGGVVAVSNPGVADSIASNFIASETGVNNAIAGALSGAVLTPGLRVTIALAHTLQAGANTFNLNTGGAVNIKSSRNVGNNIGTAYAATGIITLLYDGTEWVDVSQ